MTCAPRRGRGTQEGSWSGIGTGELKQRPRDREAETGKHNRSSATLATTSRKRIHPKTTVVTVRGELASVQGQLELKVSGTKEVLKLVADPKNRDAYAEAARKLGQTVTLHGVMEPGKDLKATVPLKISQVT
jgi:hypothetical protein